MGNCSLKGVADTAKNFNFIRIMTDSGEILKLKGPKLVGEVLQDFPGYKICGKSYISSPLFEHQELLSGQTYYLIPDGDQEKATSEGSGKEPVRMSSAALDLVTSLANGPSLEVLDPPRKGVWRVKLAITQRQLEEILSEEVNMEALIDQMRMAAAASTAPSAGGGCATPRRSRMMSWGWGTLIWKPPIISNVFEGAPPVEQLDSVNDLLQEQ